MAVEIEQMQGYGGAEPITIDLGDGDLAMTDGQFVGVVAGLFLLSIALTVATGFGTGYLAKRAFFCDV